jgi:4-hydroxybenzoyl-CoA reductase subunit beta
MTVPDFSVAEPTTVEEAVALRAANPAARYLAGGTDLIPNVRRGISAPEMMIRLATIDELGTFEETDSGLVIGAGVTVARLVEASLRGRYPALAMAADCIAGVSLREAATVGGNLCLDTRCVYYNQSEWWRRANDYCLKLNGDVCHVAPTGNRCHAAFSGDLAPAFLALGAQAVIVNPEGRRTVPLSDIYRDDGADHLALAPADLLVAVTVPAPSPGLRSAYLKSRIRRAIDFPLAGVAAALGCDGDRVAELRVALTGTNPRPMLVEGTEGLVGKVLDEALIDEVGKQVSRLIKPMRTTLVPGHYRRHVAVALTRRVIKTLAGAA